jgi:DNA-directed RNA polymerase subunit M/transcription elongation factor TFIIS
MNRHCYSCDTMFIIKEDIEQLELFYFCMKCNSKEPIENKTILIQINFKKQQKPIKITPFQLLDPTLQRSNTLCNNCNIRLTIIKNNQGKLEYLCSNCYTV